MDIQKSYAAGHDAGLDALEVLQNTGANYRDGLAGLMTVVMHAAYAMAPTEEAAEELITFNQQQALLDWETEKEIK
tara:strand:+ start:18526 stop:18753 length:228 start_codon:yes stop_codon:yes gene_type:complete